MKPVLLFVSRMICLLLPCVAAVAAEYPEKPIRMVVPWAAGGGSDVTGRIIAAKLTELVKQQVVVDNRPGAGGNIGTALAAHTPPDGYTLLLADTGFSTGVSLYTRTGYDPIKDFSPVSLVGLTPIVVVVNPAVPANSIRDLIALAKAQPGKLNFGSGGTGGSPHLAGEMFQLLTGTKLTHIAYKGTGPAVVDLTGGLIQVMFCTAPPVVPLVKAGRLRAIGVGSAARSPFFPEVPTVKEAGVPDYVADNWYGIVMPTGTPGAIVERLHGELIKITLQSEVQKRLAEAGLEARSSRTPSEFGAFLQTDVNRWADVIKRAGIKLE